MSFPFSALQGQPQLQTALLLVAVALARIGLEPRPVVIVLVWLACITPPLKPKAADGSAGPNRDSTAFSSPSLSGGSSDSAKVMLRQRHALSVGA